MTKVIKLPPSATIVGEDEEGNGYGGFLIEEPTTRPPVTSPPNRWTLLGRWMPDPQIPTPTVHFPVNPNVSPVEDLDMGKMMGRWYEGLASRNGHDQCQCLITTPFFPIGRLIRSNGAVFFTVTKSYRDHSGSAQFVFGHAWSSALSEAKILFRSSEHQQRTRNFWIYKIGPEVNDSSGNPQYEYAIASNDIQFPVVVLVRDPETFKLKYKNEVMRWLIDLCFIIFPIVQPAHSSCEYSYAFPEVSGDF